MFRFVHQSFRWLAVGFLLTSTSAFGQTWFISLFAGSIKQEHGLTDGGWGSLYTVATLSAAALMFWRGSLADTVRLSRLAPAVAVIFAIAALAMALAQSLWLLVLSLFVLRFCGQGMCSHMAMTAMGRWFEARRGQAVAISNLGHPAGEVLVPVLAVLAVAAIGWRPTWIGVATLLVLVIAPALYLLLAQSRSPQGQAVGTLRPGLQNRHWRRSDAARHWLFPALLPVLLTPGFISTVVFFHQVHIAEVKGWTLIEMAPGYSAFAATTVAASFAAGWAADRFGPHRLLPVLLIPLGIGVGLIWPAGHVTAWYVALAVIGITQGTSSALWGVLLPVTYGTRHLGSIRSLATTIMVVATAIGPGITGLLIDQGVMFPVQSLFMGGWCLILAVGCLMIARRLTRELHAEGRAGSEATTR